MAQKSITMQFRYTVEMNYLNLIEKINSPIKTESIRSIIIDHDYDNNCMPIIYVNCRLDRNMLDDMILHQNDNLILLAIYKYDDLTEMKTQEELFRKKFMYFLPDNVNKMKNADYNEKNEEQTTGDTYSELTLGLLSLEHVNNNKKAMEFNLKNNTIFDAVKYTTSHIDNVIIEPFMYSDVFEQLIVPPQESVNKTLQFLNDYRVFYNTSYRFYQDFNFTYIISSSGVDTKKDGEKYSAILISIVDIDNVAANDIGIIDDKTAKTYVVPLSYNDTQVYDNTIANKSKSKIKAISSSGSKEKSLVNKSSYSNDKYSNVRINNDNENMILNIESDTNNNNFILFFTKNDLDSSVFSINKRISIHNIDRYQEFNGDYLLRRKRELYLREDTTFVMTSAITMNKIMKSEE